MGVGGRPVSAIERAGHFSGWMLAPLFGLIALARRKRPIHSDGEMFMAVVAQLQGVEPSKLRLGTRAIVRLSASIGGAPRRRFDLLGVAIRFNLGDQACESLPSTQDVLLASSRSVLALPAALFSTNVNDFLGNEYHGMASFETSQFGRGRLRLRWQQAAQAHGSRTERLDQALSQGRAIATLEFCPSAAGAWVSLATIELRERLSIDQASFRFSPFRDGGGIRAVGYLQWLRVAPYLLAQAARPSRTRTSRALTRSGRG